MLRTGFVFIYLEHLISFDKALVALFFKGSFYLVELPLPHKYLIQLFSTGVVVGSSTL